MTFIPRGRAAHVFQALPKWLWLLVVIVVSYILVDCIILITSVIVLLGLLNGLITILSVRQFYKPWTQPKQFVCVRSSVFPATLAT